MYVGIDHGTSSIRVGLLEEGGVEDGLELERAPGVAEDVLDALSGYDIGLVAVTYSMGDALTSLKPISEVEGRGVRERTGAGEHVGAGTELFDALKSSELPAVVLPGVHQGSPNLHPSFEAYSHCASAEKVSTAYRALNRFGPDLCVSDVGSNTVTVAVKDGVLIGGVDAPIFAPGLEQGPIDVEAIRRIDSGETSANYEFSTGGTQDVGTLAGLVAMELRAVNLLVDGKPVLAGRVAEDVRDGVEELLDSEVGLLGRWAAALGGAEIARDVDKGKDDVLGFPVEF